MGSNSSQEREPNAANRSQQPDVERTISQDPKHIQDLTRLIAAETNQQREVATDNYDYRKNNMKLLKLMFKKMDPNMMNEASRRERGEIELSLKYDQTRQLLLVNVVKARNLDPMDLRGKSADPFVKLFLHPSDPTDETSHNQTRTVPKTLNPSYREIFAFPLANDQLRHCRLVAQVWDHDLLTPDDFIGEAIVNLETYQFGSEPTETWYPLKPHTNLNIQGDLEVSMVFQFPDKLMVTVHRATGLGQANGLPDPFIKLQVPGLDAVYHTEVQRNTSDPVWEETFQFDVAQEELDMRYVVLHVVDHAIVGSNESLGQVIIELSNFDLEQGCRRTFALADLKNNERAISEESQQVRMQEFREALVAHAAFRQPRLLFQKHSGKRMKVLYFDGLYPRQLTFVLRQAYAEQNDILQIMFLPAIKNKTV